MKDEEGTVVTTSYRAKLLPAIVATSFYYSFYWMVPYWITEFIIFLVKGRILEEGTKPVDWFLLFFWIFFELIMIVMGLMTFRLPKCTHLIFFVLTSIGAFLFSIAIITWVNVTLYIEVILTVITIIIQLLELILGIIVCVMQRGPMKVTPT